MKDLLDLVDEIASLIAEEAVVLTSLVYKSNSAVAADSYAADAALLTASDNADDELQAQIDEAVSIFKNN